MASCPGVALALGAVPTCDGYGPSDGSGAAASSDEYGLDTAVDEDATRANVDTNALLLVTATA